MANMSTATGEITITSNTRHKTQTILDTLFATLAQGEYGITLDSAAAGTTPHWEGATVADTFTGYGHNTLAETLDNLREKLNAHKELTAPIINDTEPTTIEFAYTDFEPNNQHLAKVNLIATLQNGLVLTHIETETYEYTPQNINALCPDN